MQSRGGTNRRRSVDLSRPTVAAARKSRELQRSSTDRSTGLRDPARRVSTNVDMSELKPERMDRLINGTTVATSLKNEGLKHNEYLTEGNGDKKRTVEDTQVPRRHQGTINTEAEQEIRALKAELRQKELALEKTQFELIKTEKNATQYAEENQVLKKKQAVRDHSVSEKAELEVMELERRMVEYDLENKLVLKEMENTKKQIEDLEAENASMKHHELQQTRQLEQLTSQILELEAMRSQASTMNEETSAMRKEAAEHRALYLETLSELESTREQLIQKSKALGAVEVRLSSIEIEMAQLRNQHIEEMEKAKSEAVVVSSSDGIEVTRSPRSAQSSPRLSNRANSRNLERSSSRNLSGGVSGSTDSRPRVNRGIRPADFQRTIDRAHSGEIPQADAMVSLIESLAHLTSADADLCDIVGTFLRSVKVDSDLATRLLGIGGMEILCKCFQVFAEGPETLTQLLAATTNLCSSETMRIEYERHGGIERMFDIMRDHPTKRSLQAQNLRMFAILASDRLHTSKLGSTDSLTRLIECLQRNKKSANVQLAGCCCLNRLLVDQETVSNLATVKSAPEAIVQAMTTHRTQHEILYEAVKCLALMGKTEQAQLQIANCDGVHSLLETMRNHQANVALQRCCCWALAVLSVNRRVQRIVLEQKGINVILLVMRIHASNADVQLQASRALINVSGDTDLAAVLISQDALPTMIGAMKHHTTNVQVQTSACWVLAHLCGRDQRASETLNSEEEMKIIMTAMEQHHMDREFSKHSCRLASQVARVKNITYNTWLLMCDRVLDAMMAHPSCVRVQDSGLTTLALICSNPVFGPQLLKKLNHGIGLTVVRASLKNHEEHEGIQNAGSWLAKHAVRVSSR